MVMDESCPNPPSGRSHCARARSGFHTQRKDPSIGVPCLEGHVPPSGLAANQPSSDGNLSTLDLGGAVRTVFTWPSGPRLELSDLKKVPSSRPSCRRGSL